MDHPGTVSPQHSGLLPQQIIQTYSADEWESFIDEWLQGFDPPYAQVIRLGGAGDKGRDVVAYVADPTDPDSEWDSYQCKHYDHALRPTDVYVELAKLCVYTFDQSYTVPRKYRFVAPHQVGTKLFDLLRSPEKVTAALVANWDQHCKKQISAAREYALEGELRDYVLAFDFRIVWFETLSEVIAQHERTKHFFRRFRIDPPVRPEREEVPSEIQGHEFRYIRCLLDAYADHLKQPVSSVGELTGKTHLQRHLSRCRGDFFSAEALARFSRDHFEANAFETVKRHIHDGVVETIEQEHQDGLARVRKVTEQAVSVQLPASELSPYLEPSDRKGVCHHLANDGTVSWCADAES